MDDGIELRSADKEILDFNQKEYKEDSLQSKVGSEEQRHMKEWPKLLGKPEM